MTFAVLVLSMLGRSVGFSHRIYLREDLDQTSLYDLLRLVGSCWPRPPSFAGESISASSGGGSGPTR